MKTPPYHPFRSARAKTRYLKRYDKLLSTIVLDFLGTKTPMAVVSP